MKGVIILIITIIFCSPLCMAQQDVPKYGDHINTPSRTDSSMNQLTEYLDYMKSAMEAERNANIEIAESEELKQKQEHANSQVNDNSELPNKLIDIYPYFKEIYEDCKKQGQSKNLEISKLYQERCKRIILSYMDGIEYQISDKIRRELSDMRSKEQAHRSSYIQESISHKKWAMEYTRSAFEGHKEKTEFIFIYVIVICSLGMLFASCHFFVSLRNSSRPTRRLSGANSQNHTAKLSASGIEISSSAVGLIIFAITVAFFFMYIKYVYPVTSS